MSCGNKITHLSFARRESRIAIAWAASEADTPGVGTATKSDGCAAAKAAVVKAEAVEAEVEVLQNQIYSHTLGEVRERAHVRALAHQESPLAGHV